MYGCEVTLHIGVWALVLRRYDKEVCKELS